MSFSSLLSFLIQRTNGTEKTVSKNTLVFRAHRRLICPLSAVFKENDLTPRRQGVMNEMTSLRLGALA